MSHPIKCDVCGRCDDEQGVEINRKRSTNWFKGHFWPEETMWERLDICDYCWNNWTSWIRNRLAAKCPTEPKL